MKEDMATEPKKKKGIDEWEVSSAVDTLLRAEEIKENGPLMKLVLKQLKKKKKAISSLAELRHIANGEDD